MSLPAGTVTFLFTDIEGSTRLLDELGHRYAEVLAEHHRLMRESFEPRRGVEVDTAGDAFFVAFERASDAVEAAAAAQRALAPTGLKVRMGIHTGEPLVTETGYVGMDVHRAARVMSAGHGGQVLISQATKELLDRDDLSDLGEHRLKDLSAPQRLWQLGARPFPPLKALHQTNLPVQPTPLVGRERELEDVPRLLADSRVVTLTGPGGSGKTRLALQAAAELVEDFEDGVYWVPLQAVHDAELILPAIADAVGAKDGPVEMLRSRRTLLLLDNLEQLLDGVPTLAELLAETTNVKLLVTSREPLRIAGEQRYPVEPLPEDDAVVLFSERARAVDPAFAVGPAVVELCRRLDGLPLALELAAARVGLLSPDELLKRLDRALPLLTGGARDAPERQRTLRATIEWSYELLSQDEQRLFRALAAFAASFDLDAVLAVTGADLDTFASLVDKSLVRRWESGRFGMLETIHEYARERLDAAGETDEVALRHARHYVQVAESTNLSIEGRGDEQHDLARAEQNNFRRALEWTLASGERALALQLAAALENFWVYADPFEGNRWLEAVMKDADDVDPHLLARALRVRGGTLYIVGEFEDGMRYYEESLAKYRELGDEWGEAHMLHRLAIDASRIGETDRARELSFESLEMSRRLGDRKGEALAFSNLAVVADKAGDADGAIELFRRSAELANEVGFDWWEGSSLVNVADVAVRAGRYDDADDALREGLRVGKRVRDRQHLVYGLAVAATLAFERGRPEAAGVLWGAIEAEEALGPIGQWEADKAEIGEKFLERPSADFERGRDEGRTLTLDAAVDRAIGDG